MFKRALEYTKAMITLGVLIPRKALESCIADLEDVIMVMLLHGMSEMLQS